MSVLPQIVRFSPVPAERAPDGSTVHPLAALPGASTAVFVMPAGAVSVAQRHRTVSEIWFVVSGTGAVWLRSPDGATLDAPLSAGVSFTIPAGTVFQFRADEELRIHGTTVPPWPGPGEGETVEGAWAPQP